MEPQCNVEELLKNYEVDLSRVQRVAKRKVKRQATIVEPNPCWPESFERLKMRIAELLGPVAVQISHVGSTSIPGMPAKDVIDVDLTVPDPTDEDAYVPRLEESGYFQFLLREPEWHEHRYFACEDPPANLHVFGPGCPELVRHRIFRDWLIKNRDDWELYARTKREAAEATTAAGGDVLDYNKLKEEVIRQILRRAFIDVGYIKE